MLSFFETKKLYFVSLFCWSNAFVFIIIAPSSFIQPSGSLRNPLLLLSCKCIRNNNNNKPSEHLNSIFKKTKGNRDTGRDYLFAGTEATTTTTTTKTTKTLVIVWNQEKLNCGYNLICRYLGSTINDNKLLLKEIINDYVSKPLSKKPLRG